MTDRQLLEHLVLGLGYAIATMGPAIIAGILWCLFTYGITRTVFLTTDVAVVEQFEPTQQLFNLAFSMIAGALVGRGVYEIKRRFDGAQQSPPSPRGPPPLPPARGERK
jgi:hypothetical protein